MPRFASPRLTTRRQATALSRPVPSPTLPPASHAFALVTPRYSRRSESRRGKARRSNSYRQRSSPRLDKRGMTGRGDGRSASPRTSPRLKRRDEGRLGKGGVETRRGTALPRLDASPTYRQPPAPSSLSRLDIRDVPRVGDGRQGGHLLAQSLTATPR